MCGVGTRTALAGPRPTPSHDLHLIGAGGNALAKLRWGESSPVFRQGKQDRTLITTT